MGFVVHLALGFSQNLGWEITIATPSATRLLQVVNRLVVGIDISYTLDGTDPTLWAGEN